MAKTSEGGVDKMLADSLKRAKKLPADRPYFFALVIKGGSEGKLIVSKKKIPTKEIAEAKKETGGSAVVKGVCYGGSDGEIVFETVKPPAPAWTALTKRLAKDDAGLAIKPLFKLGRDDEQVAESEAPDEPADDITEAEADPARAAAKAAEAAWRARVDAVTAKVKAAAAGGNPAARDMALGVSQAGALFRGGDPAGAAARLAEVEALLGGPPTGGTTKADLMKRLNGLAAGIKAALAGPNAARVGALVTAVNGLLKNDDVTQAGKNLDELESLLAPPTGGDPVAKAVEDYKARLAEWTPAIKTALAAKGPNAAEIAKLMTQAAALAKPGGNPVEALAKLTECHTLATGGGGGGGGEPTVNAPTDIPTGLVAVGVLKLELARLRKQAADGLAKIESELRVTDDPDAGELADLVLRIGAGLPAELEAVLERLDAAVKGRNTDRVKAEKAAVRDAAKGWMAFLAANADQIAACEANPWKIPVKIAGPVGDALKSILKVTAA